MAAMWRGVPSALCIVLLVGGLTGCSDEPRKARAATPWSLRCLSSETSELDDRVRHRRQRHTNPRVHERHYFWNPATGILQWQVDEEELTPFCKQEGQERCSAQVVTGRVEARSLSLAPGDTLEDFRLTTESLDIDLVTMSGTARSMTGSAIKRSSGELVLTSTVTVNASLQCERASPPAEE
jgi:hypothetical protein